MEIEQKILFLNSLGTKELIAKISEAEEHLKTAWEWDAAYRKEHVGYLASYNEDCAAVKNILAELLPEMPKIFVADEKAVGGIKEKPATQIQTESWLRQQRSTNPNVVAATDVQNQVTFQIETDRIEIEMAKKKLESLKAVLGLRAAQIEFLKE
jgi:hypothetical protein